MTFKQLTLQIKQDNILHNIECFEFINRPLMNKLLISNLLRQDLRYKNVYEPERDQLINYLSKSVSDNKIKVKYIKDKYGRSNPENSHGLYNIRREIRQTITKDYYTDIDIENAHPVILHQILKHNGIKCDHLTNYINNRKYYLDLVMNKYKVKRDVAKTLFIRLLYGGSYELWLEENKFTESIKEIIDFNYSMWAINKKIVEANPELNNWVLDKHKDDEKKKTNYNSTVVAFMLQEKEVQILEQLYIYSIDKGYIKDNNVVLCADGLMIPKENYNDNILNEYEQLIKDKFDIELKFTNKPMNEYYEESFIDNNIDVQELKELDNEINCINNNMEEINKINNDIIKLEQLNINDNTNINKSKLKLNKQLEKINNDKQKQINRITNKKELLIDKLINNNNKIIEKKKKELNKQIEIKKKIEESKVKKHIDFNLDDKYINNFDKDYIKSLITYEEKKKYFESFICKILRPDVFYVYVEKYKDIGKNQCLYKHNEIIKAFMEIKSGEYNKDGIQTSFIDKWVEDEDLKSYNKLDFVPYNGSSNKSNEKLTYNLFSGYNDKIDTIYNIENKDRYLNPFFDLLLSICGDNNDHMNYFIKFIAHMIQYPNEKMGICFILKGKQGTGKNMVLEAIGNIIGKEYYITSSNPKDFFGDYAEGFYRKLLVNMNECEGKDTFDFEGKIKSFITEDTITINPKFVRTTEIRNVARIIITTNKPNPIPIDVKSIDRRFVVFQGTEKYLDKIYGYNYWSNIKKHFNSNEFIACLYNYLNTLDISKTDWRSERPITNAYKEMIRLYSPVEALFLEDYINKSKCVFNENDLDIEVNEKKEEIINGETIKLNKFCEEYNKYCNNNGFSKGDNKLDIKKFRAKIEALEVPIKIVKLHGDNVCKFNYNEVIKFLKDKKYIERDEDELIDEIIIDNKGENFDDMFDI
jgi:hypothetical protein